MLPGVPRRPTASPVSVCLGALTLAALMWAQTAPAEPGRAIAVEYVLRGSVSISPAEPTAEAYCRYGDGPWQPAGLRRDGRVLLLDLDPAVSGRSRCRLLLDPPPWQVIGDTCAPVVLGVKVDGRPVKAGVEQELGTVAAPPRSLRFGVADIENPLDVDRVAVSIDGDAADPSQVVVERIGERQVRISVRLPEMVYGDHVVAVGVTDRAPEPNVLKATVRFRTAAAGNCALASEGATIAVDSALDGYESPVALNDGAARLPGHACLNDVSWASAEMPGDHWIEVDFGRPRLLREVVVHWSPYRGICHAARRARVQVPAGGEWVELETKRIDGSSRSCQSIFRFVPTRLERLRVCQRSGGGPAERPNLMWVIEVEAR